LLNFCSFSAKDFLNHAKLNAKMQSPSLVAMAYDIYPIELILGVELWRFLQPILMQSGVESDMFAGCLSRVEILPTNNFLVH